MDDPAEAVLDAVWRKVLDAVADDDIEDARDWQNLAYRIESGRKGVRA